MKNYFIAFDFWNEQKTFDRFFYGIISVDLSEEKLRDVCERLIKTNFNLALLGADIDDIVIKVNSLNKV